MLVEIRRVKAVRKIYFLGTGHKVREVGRQNLFKWRRFFVDPSLKRDEKASGPPHYILQNQEVPPPHPLVIMVRSIRAICMLCNDMTVGHYRSYGTKMEAMSWIMRLN